MVWRFVSGLALTLAQDHVLALDQIEVKDEAMMLLQTQAKMKNHVNLLAQEEAAEYTLDGMEDDEWETTDAEAAMAEADQWAGGYKRCFGSPRGAHSACKVIGGGVGFAASPRLCAQAAKNIGADTFQFLKNGAKCWLKSCGSVNMKYSTEGRTRPWLIFSTFCGLERIHTEVPSDCGPGLFTNYLVFPPPPPETCQHALTFSGMKTNNMNGYGPGKGAEAFRFANVLDGVDLVVKADDRYRPVNSKRNGVHRRKFGRLNMAAGTETTLLFRFVESEGQNPVSVEKFLFTVFDIDQGARCTSQMTINATKYAAYYVDENTELIVKTDIGGTTWPASSTFTSSQQGNGKDNPNFPHKLNPTQRKRAVTFEYENVKFFTMGVKMGEGVGGRNILFGGISSLTEKTCPFDGRPNHLPPGIDEDEDEDEDDDDE